MPRPHEPCADAVRAAREIVGAEGDALFRAALRPDPDACEAARRALDLRIAQAIIDAEAAARARLAA